MKHITGEGLTGTEKPNNSSTGTVKYTTQWTNTITKTTPTTVSNWNNASRVYYCRQQERGYNMFSLASNFGYIFDLYYDFHMGDEYQGVMNTTGLKDERLMELSSLMREISPLAIREYTEEWLPFQIRWTELMPMAPLCSNVYLDFYSTELQGYNIELYWNWTYAIPYAWIREAEADDGLF